MLSSGGGGGQHYLYVTVDCMQEATKMPSGLRNLVVHLTLFCQTNPQCNE